MLAVAVHRVRLRGAHGVRGHCGVVKEGGGWTMGPIPACTGTVALLRRANVTKVTFAMLSPCSRPYSVL